MARSKSKRISIPTVWLDKKFPPKFAKGEKVFIPSENSVGIIKKVLPPGIYSRGRHRYLVRIVIEFEYEEDQLLKVAQKR